jgi:hypothetical protein
MGSTQQAQNTTSSLMNLVMQFRKVRLGSFVLMFLLTCFTERTLILMPDRAIEMKIGR